MQADTLEDMIVGEVIDRWPATISVFNRRTMACPGCVMAPFMTVAETAAAYGFEAADLAGELATAIAGADRA